jgi:hypothetical protein
MTRMLKTYTGGCHCGCIKFEVTADLADTTDCNCSICTKKGFLHLIVSQDRFHLHGSETALTEYRFKTGTARHLFCTMCGIHPYYIPRSDPEKIDVNVRCVDGIDLATLRPRPFDGRDWEHAMETRAATA